MQPQLLRYKFSPGETISAKVSHRAITETTINGTTQHIETATDSIKSWKITNVDQDGLATLEHLVDHVKMMTRTSGYAEIHKQLGSIKQQVYQVQDEVFGY